MLPEYESSFIIFSYNYSIMVNINDIALGIERHIRRVVRKYIDNTEKFK